MLFVQLDQFQLISIFVSIFRFLFHFACVVLHVLCVFVRQTVASAVECGLFGRSSQASSLTGPVNRMAYQTAGNSQQYANYNYNQNPQLNVNNNNNNNIGGQRRTSYLDQNQDNLQLRKNLPRATSSGLSAWGLITIIMLIIVIGMGGYYGILCYPLICKEERNYDIMDAASTTASANTPTRSSDFEKSGNYSSRSTTPSVIINT